MKETLKIFSVAAITAIIMFAGFSFRPAPETTQGITYQYFQFSTIESVIPGGLGRSILCASLSVIITTLSLITGMVLLKMPGCVCPGSKIKTLSLVLGQ